MWNEKAELDDEPEPVVLNEEYWSMQRILQKCVVAFSFLPIVLYAVLLITDPIAIPITPYHPRTSSFDVIIASSVMFPVVLMVLCGKNNWWYTIGKYATSFLFFTITGKLWVYRAWKSQPLDTVIIVVALVTSALEYWLMRKLKEHNLPKQKKLRWKSMKMILMPYFIPRGCCNKALVIITWIVVLIGKVCTVIAPLFLGLTVTQLSKTPPEDATLYISLFCLFGLIPKATSEIQDILYVKVWQVAFVESAEITFRHVHSLSLDWHLRKKLGQVLRSMDRGLEAADTLMQWLMITLLPNLGSAIVSFFIFAIHFDQPEIAAICYLGLCYYVWLTIAVTAWRTKFNQEMNVHDNEMHDKATDSLINFETVKYFSNEDFEAERYLDSVKHYQRCMYNSQASISILNVSQQVIIQACMLLSLMLAAHTILVQSGKFGTGPFVAIQAYIATIYGPLSYLGTIYTVVVNAVINMQNLSDLLATEADVRDDPKAIEFKPKDTSIEFQDVRFHYPAQSPDQGIKNVSFFVPSGTTTAIVGHTGSGKTTLSRLLFRFYDISGGKISVGGLDVRNVQQKSLRQTGIGIVPQDTCMFNDTIKHNISYGKPNATQEEIESAAKQAQLYDFVMRLEKKWDSEVGERGLKLSGGEKQRVAIARCLLKNPPVIVLDEATSALDNKTEKEVQNTLRCLSGRTTLVIAHRLTTIQNADQILVMKHGTIVERGTHQELLKDKLSEYATMYNAQLIEQHEKEAKEGKLRDEALIVDSSSAASVTSEQPHGSIN